MQLNILTTTAPSTPAARQTQAKTPAARQTQAKTPQPKNRLRNEVIKAAIREDQ